jgi:hypothetical protein
VHICSAGESSDAVTDRPWDALQGLDALERFGDLAAPAQATLGGHPGLHRRLCALAIPADAQRVASPEETPVLRVVVDIGQLTRSSGDDGQSGGRRMLLKPILNQLEIDCLELPLDLLVVQHLLLHGVGNHPKNHLN